VQMESLMKEKGRMREVITRLSRENENLHELLVFHHRKAGRLDGGDDDRVCASDVVCNDLDDTDIDEHVPAHSLARADSDGVPDADCGVPDGEREPLLFSGMDHRDFVLHALRAKIRAELGLGVPSPVASEPQGVEGDRGGICRMVQAALRCGGDADLTDYGHAHEDSAVHTVFDKVGIG
jgi:hypothetical protein